MQSKVTIIMYHFVRDLARSPYPEIKGLSLNDFRGQLAYIQKFYTPVTMADVFEAVSTKKPELPPRAVLLTFDDGYADHFLNVFPLLNKHGIQGAFFPPARVIDENKVLDVNKIHFVLASVQEKNKIIKYIHKEIERNRKRYSLNSFDFYFNELAIANRYDTAEVIFIKRILQRDLPEVFRRELTNALFENFVTADEAAFASELYMNPEQLACMRRNGMYIGSHGYDHKWLNTLNPEEQEDEIEQSLVFLEHLGCKNENWAMCYPYGGYNNSLLSIIKQKGCRIGLTTNVGLADLRNEDPLLLSRLDTNDLPKVKRAKPDSWTWRVMEENVL